MKKENEAFKDRKIREIRTLFKQEDDNNKPIRVGNFWNNTYMGYESSGCRNTNLTVKGYLDKIKPYLGDIIMNLQKSYTRKI